jgi:membrane-bound metal-dependent hydrolase YbcI (DUF457 family)
MASGIVRHILRLEGLAMFAATLAVYIMLHGSWLTFIILFLAPDLSFLAYLAGPVVGARVYNLLHALVLPLLLCVAGWAFYQPDLWKFATIWIAHIGFDRMLGYGLKYESGFKDTHLGQL